MTLREEMTVEEKPPERWLIRACRSAGGETAEGSVLVRAGAAPDPTHPHARLAGARAWLALAESFEGRTRWADAAASARSGLDELGHEYAGPGVEDDTPLNVLSAEEMLAEGRTADGASGLLEILHERLGLYAELHEGSLVE